MKDVGFQNVYLTRDMTPEEREQQKKLREELQKIGKDTHKNFQGKIVPRQWHIGQDGHQDADVAEHIKNTKKHDKLIVKLINIQGLSQTKNNWNWKRNEWWYNILHNGNAA